MRMLRGNRGVLSARDAMWLIVYVMVAMAVAFALAKFPEGLLQRVSQPVMVDAELMSLRAQTLLTFVDPFTGWQQSVYAGPVSARMGSLVLSPKKFGLEISSGADKYYPSAQSEKFFKAAREFAPSRNYALHEKTYQYRDASGRPVSVRVTQVYPTSYEAYE
ncbi:hypothetical protein HY489_04225 [Candidatus Woesearchaeota archaeon]|nr:hypothetical protein [Candidatus Woesearchaeota archaeon]